MYPTQELSELAWRKQAVRTRIALHRLQCVESAAALEPSVTLFDRAVKLWQSVSATLKWVGLPLALLAAQKAAPRVGGVKRLLRYVPVILDVVEAFFGARGRRPAGRTDEQKPAGAT